MQIACPIRCGLHSRLPRRLLASGARGPYNARELPVLTVLTNAFPLWLLLASGIALVRPGLFTWFSGPFITVGLGVIMLSMGMTVGFEDFRRIARERTSVLPGVALQYTLMPLLGWSIGWLLELPTPFAVGLILVSCCPGGTASNVITFLARADVALSVTMTTASTLLAVLMTPTLTALLAGSRIDVPAGGLLLDTVQVVVLPVVAGAVLKARFPTVCRRVLPVAPLVAVATIVLIAASVIGGGREQVIEAGGAPAPRRARAAHRRVRARLRGGPAVDRPRAGGADRGYRGGDAELRTRGGAGAAELRESAGSHPERDVRRDALGGRQRRRRLLAPEPKLMFRRQTG